MPQQTAVEWLIKQLPVKIRVELYEKNIHVQALKMEKEQIKDAIIHNQNGLLRRQTVLMAEQYYNETYGKQ